MDAVRDAYRAILEQPGVLPEVAAQARLLMWRGEAPRRALFGGCGTAVFRLFVDGRPVGEGGGAPAVFQAFPVELEPGPCRLSAEVVSRGDGSWYALGFFSGFTNVVSDGSWDYSLARPDGWPSGDGAPSLWKPVNAALWCFPSMQWWAFQPNAFPGVQSGQQVGGPTAGWERPAGRTIYLRRRMDVPKDDRRATPFRRRKELRMPPIRPAGDRSNEEPSRPSAVGG